MARKVLPRKLGSSSCRDWYKNLSNIEKNQYPVLKSRFLTQFVPQSFYMELLRFLQHRVMRPNESVQSYFDTIQDVKAKLGDQCPQDSVVCGYFRSGLNEKIRKCLPLHQRHANFSNLDQLLESARIIEGDNMSCISGVHSSLLDGIDDRGIDCDSYLSEYEAGRSRLKRRNYDRKRRALLNDEIDVRASGNSSSDDSDSEAAQHELLLEEGPTTAGGADFTLLSSSSFSAGAATTGKKDRRRTTTEAARGGILRKRMIDFERQRSLSPSSSSSLKRRVSHDDEFPSGPSREATLNVMKTFVKEQITA